MSTFAKKTQKEVDLKDLDSPQKVAQLKKSDPFMYYSLPLVQDAVMHGKETEEANIQVSSQGTGNNQGSTVVKRRSCIAFESHGNALFEELLGTSTSDAASLGDDGDDLFDMFVSYEPAPSAKRPRNA